MGKLRIATLLFIGHSVFLPLSIARHHRGASVVALILVGLVAPASAQDTITFLNSWGSIGTANGQFSGPDGIAIGSTDTVYVTDLFNNRAQYFDRAGNLGIVRYLGIGQRPIHQPVGHQHEQRRRCLRS